MAKVDITVEINDGSLFATLAAVREKERELSAAIRMLEQVVTGCYSEFAPGAAVVREKPQE